jgi:hypothetical protein
MLRFSKKSMYTIGMVLALFLTPVSIVAAQESMPSSKVVIVTGTGQIEQNDLAKAREDAISESLITAVGLTMADIIPIEILVPNFQSLNEILYVHTDNFINGYRVLTETRYKDQYRVLVQARVSTQKIVAQLKGIGIMTGEIEKPKVLLMIAEQNVNDLEPHYWWKNQNEQMRNQAESILAETLTRKGFRILTHPGLPAPIDSPDGFTPSEPDRETILRFAQSARADIAIVGRAFAEQTSNTMGEDVRSFKATFMARAIRMGQMDEIGKTFQTAITVNTDEITGGFEAISQAAALTGEDLAVQLTTALSQKKNEKSVIKIVVEGTRSLSNFVKFRRALRDLADVGEIQSSEIKANETTLNVEYSNDINSLANSLMIKSFDSFGINISNVAPDQLHVTLVPIVEIEDAKAPAAAFEANEIQ